MRVEFVLAAPRRGIALTKPFRAILAGGAICALSLALIALSVADSASPIYIATTPTPTEQPYTSPPSLYELADAYAANTHEARRGVIDPRTGKRAEAGEMLPVEED